MFQGKLFALLLLVLSSNLFAETISNVDIVSETVSVSSKEELIKRNRAINQACKGKFGMDRSLCVSNFMTDLARKQRDARIKGQMEHSPKPLVPQIEQAPIYNGTSGEGGTKVRIETTSGTVRMTKDQIKEMNQQCAGKTSLQRSLCQMDYRVNLAKKDGVHKVIEKDLDKELKSLGMGGIKKKRKIKCGFGAEKCKEFDKKVGSCPANYSDKKCEALATYDVMTPESVKKLCSHSDKMACSLYAKKFMGRYVKNKGSVKNVAGECNKMAKKYSTEYEKIAKNFKSGEGDLVSKLDKCLGDDKLNVFDDGRINGVCSQAKDSSEMKKCKSFFAEKNSEDMGKCVEQTNKFMAENHSDSLSLEDCSEMADGSRIVTCNGFQYKLTDNVLNTSRRLGKFVEGQAGDSDSDGSSSFGTSK